jgi:hypothetical protein
MTPAQISPPERIGFVGIGWRRLRMLAAGPQHVVPGHDPLVMQRYRAPRPDLEGIAVRLDDAPRPAR